MKHGMRKNNKTVGEVLLNVYIANLGAYNRGELIGQWVSLPMEREDLDEVISEILGNDEEYAIHDYESNLGLEVGEYENIHQLNEQLAKVEEYEVDLLGALIRNYGLTLEEAIIELEDTHYFQLDKDTFMSDESNLAYAVIDELGFDGINLTYHFNWELFGRDLSYDLDMILEGLEDDEKEEYYNMSDVELAEWYIFDVVGSLDHLDRETLERYFDYESYGHDLMFDYAIDHETMIATCSL